MKFCTVTRRDYRYSKCCTNEVRRHTENLVRNKLSVFHIVVECNALWWDSIHCIHSSIQIQYETIYSIYWGTVSNACCMSKYITSTGISHQYTFLTYPNILTYLKSNMNAPVWSNVVVCPVFNSFFPKCFIAHAASLNICFQIIFPETDVRLAGL